MKKHKGLGEKSAILFHILQQAAAWIATAAITMLAVYSVVCVETEGYPYNRKTFRLDLFVGEKHFEETAAFDQMLMSALQEIIRYNVAKSQLETDGKYDGTKEIDIRAFVNRKTDLARGLDTPEETTRTIVEIYDEGDGTVEFAVYLEERMVKYYLEDLLKWQKYGFHYEETVMTATEFVTYFDKHYLDRFDGIWTEEQEKLLQSYLGNGSSSYTGISPKTLDYLYVIFGYGEEEKDKELTDELLAEYERNAKVWGEEGSMLRTFVNLYDTDIRTNQALLSILSGSSPVYKLYVDGETGNIMVHLFLLQERYQTVNGGNLSSLAGDWEEYLQLWTYVEQTAGDLAYNYKEYLEFEEKYGEGATNIVYTFDMEMLGEPVRVSNLPQSVKGDLDSYYKSAYGRYMIYRPKTMTFESNTGIVREDDLFNAFANYEYAYPETAEIRMGVDTGYPVWDQFAQAASAYQTMHPYAYPVLVIAGLAFTTWFVLWLFLSVMAGRRKEQGEEEAKLILCWFDSVPTEAAAALGGGLAAAGIWLIRRIYIDLSGKALAYICNHRMKTVVLIGIFGCLLSSLFCLFWYSLVRRIKAHALIKSSLVKWIWDNVLLKLCRAVKKLLLKMYDNSGILFRCILLHGGVMCINLFMGGFICFFWQRSGNMVLVPLIFTGMLVFDGIVICLWLLNYLKRKKIVDGIARIRDGEVTWQVPLQDMHGENLRLAEAVNSIGEGIKTAVETSMKDERLKADLITNVSHDIKTPLTSIVNYVDLLKREKIETQPVKGYIEVLDAKSQRLKQLTDDLVEASKISSGNITLIMEKINLTELLHQSLGEFSEKFEEKKLQVVEDCKGDTFYIEADSRRIWRVIENLFNNIYKYALEGTRIYLDMAQVEGKEEVMLSIKNISAQPLNIRAEELTERFIRGDVSRSTEGSGLGLSIAKNLTELQNGRFEIYLDGDLFKVTLTFPLQSGETA